MVDDDYNACRFGFLTIKNCRMINYLFKEQNWQTQLADLVTDPHELLQLLQLKPEQLNHDAWLAHSAFKLRVPRQFVAKMQINQPLDPLLLQVLPHHLEMQNPADFSDDPLQELDIHQNNADLPTGMLHKYRSRILLTMTGACAIHCRYCFRRHFPYQNQQPKAKDWDKLAAYIVRHPELNEVILSGGDPLTLNNAKLSDWINRIAQLPQIKILRLHSRVPVVIPQRIDSELLNIFASSRLKIILVVHSNHAQELDAHFDQAMAKLKSHGVTLLNQTVLLKGINDDIETLNTLSYRLFQADVLPYYLHILDKVRGASHFLISDQHALRLYNGLLKCLPGYLVPKLVREIAGEASKTPLMVIPLPMDVEPYDWESSTILTTKP